MLPALLSNRNVVIVFATVLILGVVSAFTSWFLPIYLARHGALPLVVSVYTAANLLGIPLVLAGGLLADVYGRKPLVVLSTLLYAVSFSLLLLEVQVAVAVAAVLMLFSSALAFSPLTALLGESVEEDKVAVVFSWKRLVSAIAVSIGSLLVGYLALAGARSLVLVCLVASLVALAARLFLVETALRRVRASVLAETLKILRSAGAAFKLQRRIRVIAVAVVVVSLGNGIFEIYFPIHLSEDVKLDEPGIGAVYAVGSITSTLFFVVAGHVVERLGWLRSLLLALLAESMLILLLALIPTHLSNTTLPLMLVALLYALLSLVSSVDQVSGNKMLISITDPETRGTVIASLASLTLLSKVFSPGVGALAAQLGYHVSLVTASLTYLAGSIALLTVKRHATG